MAKSKAKGQAGKEFIAFEEHVLQSQPSLTARKIQTVFLPRFLGLFCLLSSKILQNNLLDLYLVEIRRYKLSFFAKHATKFFPREASFLVDLKESLREAQSGAGAETRHIIG